MSQDQNGEEKVCDPFEIALKSMFLGPQAENAPWILELLNGVFLEWVRWRRSLYPADGCAISPEDQSSFQFEARKDQFRLLTTELMSRFEKEVPKFSPRYIGHMFSEFSLPALVGHIATLLHNPNNISGESSRVGIGLEHEAIGFLGKMVGFDTEEAEGHFTSGGTVANLEALIRAHSRCALWLSAVATQTDALGEGKFRAFRAAHIGWDYFESVRISLQSRSIPDSHLTRWNLAHSNPFEVSRKLERLSGIKFQGPVILVPENMHYSWKKGAHLIGIGAGSLWPVKLDRYGRLSIESLRALVERAEAEDRPVLMVVSVAGTTELGTVDGVGAVQDLLDEWKNKGVHIWHHVDAAYGGFFCSLNLDDRSVVSPDIAADLRAIARVNSVTLDPHKLGYVPYSSGAFISRKHRDYFFSSFEDVPYIDFRSKRDRGPYTLEGSRSAAGAVATWMTAKSIGLDSKGYGLLLERTIRIRRNLAARLEELQGSVWVAPVDGTNILCLHCAQPGESLANSNRRTLEVFEHFSQLETGEFMLSKTTLSMKSYGELLTGWLPAWNPRRDADEVVLLRLCLMNPFFESMVSAVDYGALFVKCLKERLA